LVRYVSTYVHGTGRESMHYRGPYDDKAKLVLGSLNTLQLAYVVGTHARKAK